MMVSLLSALKTQHLHSQVSQYLLLILYKCLWSWGKIFRQTSFFSTSAWQIHVCINCCERFCYQETYFGV